MTTLNLISGPRNISTALMYSFAQRTDTCVADEPFYAVYLTVSGALHPGREEVLANQSSDEKTVRIQLASYCDKEVLFIKNMAHHVEVLREPLLEGAINIFLIRDPRQIIASYAQVIQAPIMRDIGIEYQYRLFETLQRSKENIVVVDSGILLQDPKTILKLLCERCGIPFQETMLRWKSGPKPYDGVWATHWYSNVHASTGFEKQQTSERTLPHTLTDLYHQARGYYEKLLPFSLKA